MRISSSHLRFRVPPSKEQKCGCWVALTLLLYICSPHRAVDLFNAALKAAEQVQEPASAWTMTHLNLGLAYRRVGFVFLRLF